MEKILLEKNEIPFKGDFNRLEGISSKIKVPLVSPDKVIKATPFEDYLFNESGEAVKNIKETEKLLDELKSKYNINIPKNECVIGKNEKGKKSIFFVTDRIQGENFTDIARFKNKIDHPKEKVENLLSNLLQYLIDKTKNNEPFLWDIFKRRNYLIETKKDGLIYLVDLEGYIVSPEDKKHYDFAAWLILAEIVKIINNIEKEIYEGQRMDDIRRKVGEARKSLSATTSSFD